MKTRAVALLLTLTLLLTTVITVLPVTVNAVGATAESVNYAEGEAWSKWVGTPTVTLTEKGAVMTNLHNSWDSVGIDLLPIFKSAMGEEDQITVKLSVNVRATLRAGQESSTVQIHPLIRGTGTEASNTAANWFTAYADSIQGDYPLFEKAAGNIMMNISHSMAFTHNEWQTFETTLNLTRNQLLSHMISEWIFCVDGVSPLSVLQAVEFADLSVTVTESTEKIPDDSNLPQPQESYTTEVWTPAEIILHSTVAYDNPYVATEIDATFTHTDGTEITLPGFWMQGNTWAVRFSPTKVGEWSYRITCKDTSNTGLFETGKVIATEATGSTDIAQHGFVTTVKDQRYYQHADGTPFFWLGDTNWQAFTQLSTTICNYPGCDCGSQFKHIVDDRVEKGFTVYQTYFVPEGGNGEPGLWLDSWFQKPDTTLFNEKVDEMFAYLHEQGLTIALGLGCHSSTMNKMRLDAVLRFTRYVVARYACYSVVWISGQEITESYPSATEGYDSFDCYMALSSLIEELDGYKHPNSAHTTKTYEHEFQQALDHSDWHDAFLPGGGHGPIPSKSMYEGFYNARGAGYAKPLIEGEANYEDINCLYFTGYEASRISAWKAMLCGCAGFTYGVTGIWAGCFSTESFTGWYDGFRDSSYEPWYMGLDKPGSFEMTYMKQFFRDVGPWYDLIPRYSDRSYATLNSREDCVFASTEDNALMVLYFYGEAFKQRSVIRCLDSEKSYDAYWFNPRTGKYIPVAKGISSEDGRYTVPELPNQSDWVFLLTSLGIPEHYEEALPVDLNPDFSANTPTGSVVTPADVTAIGGITYSGTDKANQTMTDPTLYLYDGNPATVWKPSADRITQTFLFDLGTVQKLTYLQINTVEGTVIPDFRVEGSNDGILWTVITDTSVREAANPGVGREPLAGSYRYVKVILLNAEIVSGDVPYKTIHNPINDAVYKSVYSVTEISDILIYSDGEGEPTPEILVGGSNTEIPGETETDTQESNPGETDPAEQNTAADTTEIVDTETDKANEPKKGCASAISAGAITLVIAAAAAALSKKKEE